MANIVESASDIIVSTSSKGDIITWNPAAVRVTGFRLDEVKNRSLFEFFCARHRTEAEETFKNLGRLRSVGQSEWHLRTRDSGEIPVFWLCSAMEDDHGHIEGIVAAGRYLREWRRLEAEAMQSQKLAALGIMAGGIAHELRNPLAVASAASEFLMEGGLLPVFIHECAGKISGEIERASTMIDSMLAFSRPSAIGKFAEPVDLDKVVREAMKLAANEARLSKVQVEAVLPKGQLVVPGNPGLLQQLVMNLILNALDATAEGGSVSIILDTEGRMGRIRVVDTGCGIPEEIVGNIFDPFFTTRPSGKGTGLGLALSHSIVRQHCGTVDVDSTEGVGTTFTIRLPLMREDEGSTMERP